MVRRALLLCAAVALTACSEPCVRMREVTVVEQFSSVDSIGMVRIRVVDEDAREDFMGWQISINSLAEDVTAIHLHARPVPGAPVAEIFSFPVTRERTPVIVINHSQGRGPFEASIPIDAFMSAMRDTSAYVDFHTPSRPLGRSRTTLVPTIREWGEYCF